MLLLLFQQNLQTSAAPPIAPGVSGGGGGWVRAYKLANEQKKKLRAKQDEIDAVVLALPVIAPVPAIKTLRYTELNQAALAYIGKLKSLPTVDVSASIVSLGQRQHARQALQKVLALALEQAALQQQRFDDEEEDDEILMLMYR